MSDELAVVARLSAQPGRRDELVEACRGAVAGAAAEEGTLEYRLHLDASDPDVVWFYERYRDRDAFDTHSHSDGMRAFGKSVKDLLAAKPELTFTTPIAEA
jgi:quinol monooxygenase YgiN